MVSLNLQCSRRVSASSLSRSRGISFSLHAASSADNSLFEKDNGAERVLDQLDESPLKYRTSEADELHALKYADVALADNFYEGTYPRTKRSRSIAIEEMNTERRMNVDANFYDLMNMGFERRLLSENDGSGREARFTALRTAAKYTETKLELHKSKEEQLNDLKRQRLMQRPNFMKLIPQGLHKFIDYVVSMRITPKSQELTKNVLLGTFFSFIVWVNSSARSAFMYFVVGNLAVLSSLLTRNMPKIEVSAGMDKNKKVTSWSSTSFKTAAVLTLGFSLLIALTTSIVLYPFSVTLDATAKAAMVSSMIGVSYLTSFFEVYEEKSKNGTRWRKAIEGTLSDDVQAKLSEQVFGKEALEDKYDYDYNPEIDEYPPQPKYLDEVQGDSSNMPGGSGAVDETVSNEHFIAWKKERKDSRRPPVEDAAPETPWVGSKEGMYVKKVPSWLNAAYKKNVLKANAWRDKPTKFVKDFQEFEPVEGPYGFRDKRPGWFSLFGTGVWEEKTTASRRAARSFGTYRKTMWKIDKKVKLQNCDGADKTTGPTE